MKFQYIACIILFFVGQSTFALDWKSATVTRTIDTEHVLLSNGKVVQLIGFDGPDHLFPTLKERGTARRTFQLLKGIFETQSIKILKDETDCSNSICPRHIKLENGGYLVEFLLKKGLGKFKSQPPNTRFDRKFQRAENKAKEENIGIWDTPEYIKTINTIRRTAGVMTNKWKKKYGHFLAPISIGRVKSIESGNRFHLENGLCIRLLGVQTPSPLDQRQGHNCFGGRAQNHLASLILGKTVELIQDNSQFDDRYCLQRHVWLPSIHKKMNSRRHINQEMIANGFGKVNFPQGDNDFVAQLNAIQSSVFQNPQGAWLDCAAEILGNDKPKKIRPSDPNCPVKVSQSGKIHTQKSGWYSRLKNVQCFESVETATEAGFK